MTDMVKRAKIRRAYGRMQEILDQEGVHLKAFDTLPGIYLALEGGPIISIQELALLQPWDTSKPPMDYDAFVAEATDVFVAKDRDYQSRFMRALCDIEKDPRTIWAWEVEKKLDRIRTWVATGKLSVKDEGVKNSVQDIFVYTIQWGLYQAAQTMAINPFDILNERHFYATAIAQRPPLFLSILFEENVLDQDEVGVCQTINKYMGVSSE